MSEMTIFTDQKRHIATQADCNASWGGGKRGTRFRCSLCGHRFKVGDGFRWVYSGGATFDGPDGKKWGVINLKTCDA